MSAEIWVVESKRADSSDQWWRPTVYMCNGQAEAERQLEECRAHASEGVEYRVTRYVPEERSK